MSLGVSDDKCSISCEVSCGTWRAAFSGELCWGLLRRRTGVRNCSSCLSGTVGTHGSVCEGHSLVCLRSRAVVFSVSLLHIRCVGGGFVGACTNVSKSPWNFTSSAGFRMNTYSRSASDALIAAAPTSSNVSVACTRKCSTRFFSAMVLSVYSQASRDAATVRSKPSVF